MSHAAAYRDGMKAKRTHTGFGLYDTGRQVARRRQRAIERTETPPPPMRLTPEAQIARDIFEYARQFKRPLAA
jgi:hypothetical protein